MRNQFRDTDWPPCIVSARHGTFKLLMMAFR